MQKPVRLRAAEDLPWRHLNVKNEIKLKIKRGCAKYFLSSQLFVIFLRKKLVLLLPRTCLAQKEMGPRRKFRNSFHLSIQHEAF